MDFGLILSEWVNATTNVSCCQATSNAEWGGKALEHPQTDRAALLSCKMWEDGQTQTASDQLWVAECLHPHNAVCWHHQLVLWCHSCCSTGKVSLLYILKRDNNYCAQSIIIKYSLEHSQRVSFRIYCLSGVGGQDSNCFVTHSMHKRGR